MVRSEWSVDTANKHGKNGLSRLVHDQGMLYPFDSLTHMPSPTRSKSWANGPTACLKIWEVQYPLSLSFFFLAFAASE